MSRPSQVVSQMILINLPEHGGSMLVHDIGYGVDHLIAGQSTIAIVRVLQCTSPIWNVWVILASIFWSWRARFSRSFGFQISYINSSPQKNNQNFCEVSSNHHLPGSWMILHRFLPLFHLEKLKYTSITCVFNLRVSCKWINHLVISPKNGSKMVPWLGTSWFFILYMHARLLSWKRKSLLFPAPSAKGYAMPREMAALVPCRGKTNPDPHTHQPTNLCKW